MSTKKLGIGVGLAGAGVFAGALARAEAARQVPEHVRGWQVRRRAHEREASRAGAVKAELHGTISCLHGSTEAVTGIRSPWDLGWPNDAEWRRTRPR